MRGVYAVSVLTLGWVVAACTRDEIVSVDPEQAPGTSASTVEALFELSQFAGYTDTVFFGFAGPADACRAPLQYIRIEGGSPDLTSRGLLRFIRTGTAVFPDTIAFADTISAVARFDSVRVVLTVDSARSSLPEMGSTLQLRGIGEDWDRNSADWVLAVDSLSVQTPWSTPGGALGAVVSEVLVTPEDDSVVFRLGAASDSLIAIWRDSTQPNTGVAVVVADSGRLVALTPRLLYRGVPELDPDTAVDLVPITPRDCTFIFDPPGSPLPAGVLRVGGVNGWRIFAEMLIPDSVTVEGFQDPLQLRRSTIGRAELFLFSRDAPASPFVAENSFTVSALQLADSFTVFGAKTPVSEPIADSDAPIDPDSLQAGLPVIVGLTQVVQELAEIPFGLEVPPLRFVIRAVPEAATFGFWEFGAADGDPAIAPMLRVIFTPPTDFAVP